MKQPFASIVYFPQAPGRCHHCGKAILDSREASIQVIGDRPRLVCRDAAGCASRSKEVKHDAGS